MAYDEQEKLSYTRFVQNMKAKKPGNFYVFHGPEAYLRQHWLERLHALVVDPACEEFNYHRFTQENVSARAVADSIDALPMFGGRSLVQIDDVDLFRLDEDERAGFAAAFADLPDYCTVVLCYETVEWKPDRRQKKLAAALDKAEVVCFRSPSERELCTWVARHFKSHEKSVSYETCQYLIRRTGGDMTTLASEIEKVAAYCEGEQITKEEIDAVVEPVLEAAIFDLTDAVAAGRYDRALETLETLLRMQEEPIPILAAISGQMRRILSAKTLLGAGKSIKDLMALCGIKSYPAGKTMDCARRLSDRFCERAVLLCLETDERIKTSYDAPERLLELLVLRLAQEAGNA